MDYEIRWAQEEDARELGLVHSESWKIAYKDIIPNYVLVNITPERREEYFRDAIKNRSVETAVIKVDNQIIGFVTLGQCRDEDMSSEFGEIWGVYLSPSYWHKGFGSILFNFALKELGLRGFKKVSLWVLEDNLGSRRFYEKHGLLHDGTVKKLKLGKEINEIRYIKSM